jgi:hypothetical protein
MKHQQNHQRSNHGVFSRNAKTQLPRLRRMLEIVAFGREVVENFCGERLDDNNVEYPSK